MRGQSSGRRAPSGTALRASAHAIAAGVAEPTAALPFPYRGAVWDALLDDLADRIAARLAERSSAAEATPADGPGELLTAREVCRLLHVSRSSLDRLVRRGHIEVCKVGAHNRYPRCSIEVYVTRAREGGDAA